MSRKNFKKNAVTLGITLLLLLGIGEIFMRWYLTRTDDTTKELTIYQSSEIVGWEHLPNAEAKQNWDGREITYTINSYGLRGKEIALKKLRGKKRIAILGDSFAFGMLMNDEETFASRLEELAKKDRNRQIEALNFGVIGYGVDQYFLTLKNKVFEFKPDIVIVAFFVGNDATELRGHEWALDTAGNLSRIHDKWHVISEDNQLRRKKTSLLPRSYLFAFFKERGRIALAKLEFPVRWPNLFFSNFLPPEHRQGDPRINEYYEKSKMLLLEMKKITEEKRAKFLVTFIPADIQVHLKYLSKYPGAPLAKEAEAYYEWLALPQAKLIPYAKFHGIPSLDLFSPFHEFMREHPEKDLYFPKKDPHFNENGHSLAAKIIYANLKERGWL